MTLIRLCACALLLSLLPAHPAHSECTFLCTEGNYNQSWRKSLCLLGKNPGVDQRWYDEYYTYNGVVWDSMGSGQDHRGVCVSTYPADQGLVTNRMLFHDGCSAYPDGTPRKVTIGPNVGWQPNNWGQVFHSACMMHDLCFKAEPNFSNKTKSQCDDQMELYAKQICHASYQEINNFLQRNDLALCLDKANNARFWMQFGGSVQYEAFNIYPVIDWRPNGGICRPGQRYDVVRNRCMAPSLCPYAGVHQYDTYHTDGKVVCKKIGYTAITAEQCYTYQGTAWNNRCVWEMESYYDSIPLQIVYSGSSSSSSGGDPNCPPYDPNCTCAAGYPMGHPLCD